MRKLKKGDKVVITCEDSRNNFAPTVASVETSGKRWVTVRLEGTNCTFPWYFDVQNPYQDSLCGGSKDGSYQIYRLYDFSSIEDYEYGMKMRMLKKSVQDEILKLISSNLYQIPYEVLCEIKEKLNCYNTEE